MRIYGHHFKTKKRILEVLELPKSTYYDAIKSKYHDKYLYLKDKIEEIHQTFPGYGYRRISAQLSREGMSINDKVIRKVMKTYGLHAIQYAKRRVNTTQSHHNLTRYPNIIRGLEPKGINELWVTDLTYVCIGTRFVYVNCVMDRFSRKIIGYSISKSLKSNLCTEALKMALNIRNPGSGCIHHSDQGVQYASQEYVNILKENGFKISMSRKGNPYDNAHMESFFKTYKYEEVHLMNYESMRDVMENLPKFIDDIYNNKRLHSSLGYVTPNEFEDLFIKQQTRSLKRA